MFSTPAARSRFRVVAQSNTSLRLVVAAVAGILAVAAVQVGCLQAKRPLRLARSMSRSAAAEPEAHLPLALADPGGQTAVTQSWPELLQPQAAVAARRERSAATRLSQAAAAAVEATMESQRRLGLELLGRVQTAVPVSIAEATRPVVVAAARAVWAAMPPQTQAAHAVPGLHLHCQAVQSPTARVAAGRVNQPAVWAAACHLAVTLSPTLAPAAPAVRTLSLAVLADRVS
jgi:hypothetical protein